VVMLGYAVVLIFLHIYNNLIYNSMNSRSGSSTRFWGKASPGSSDPTVQESSHLI
jgi:hypothetical protein